MTELHPVDSERETPEERASVERALREVAEGLTSSHKEVMVASKSLRRAIPTPLVCSCGTPLEVWRIGEFWAIIGAGHVGDLTAAALYDESLSTIMEAFIEDPGCLHLSEGEEL